MSDAQAADRAPRPFPAIPMLAELREACLERSKKRMPIWRVRFAPDLVAQIQPKPVTLICQAALDRGYRQHRLCFEGKAVMTENATAGMLEKLPTGRDIPNWWSRRFTIVDDPDNANVWILKGTGGRWKREADIGSYYNMLTRILDHLKSGFFDSFRAERMLVPACVLCGKPLTDPASMARWVGPECSGNGSLRVPGLLSVRLPLVAEAVTP